MKTCYWVVFLLLWVSCTNEEIPDNVIPQVKMAQIMLEAYEVEVKIDNNITDLKPEDLFHPMMEKVYNKYEINDSIYRVSLTYYMTHPKFFDEVYDIMIDSLKLRQQMDLLPTESGNGRSPLNGEGRPPLNRAENRDETRTE